MKAIMQAYSPEELKRIARGEQTIKVCKTAPKLETPFKCYIYCSKGKTFLYKNPNNGELFLDSNGGYRGGDYEDRFLTGKVIGEFICDKVIKYEEHIEQGGLYYTLDYGFNEACQLDNWELHDYGKGKPLYAWHISDLKFYDRPKKLTDFNKPCVDKYQYCQGCKYGSIVLSADEEEYALYHVGQCEYFETVCHNYVSCPPRSWKYVEELEQ